MKKLVALALALVMLCSTAYAAVDWGSMTDDEILAEIDNAKNELVKRELTGNTDNITVVNEAGVTIVFKSYEIDKSSWWFSPALLVKYTIVNQSEDDYEMFVDNIAINGWEVESSGYCAAAAGHKAKGELMFDLEAAEVSDLDELETIEISFHYQVPNEFKYNYTEPITIVFE